MKILDTGIPVPGDSAQNPFSSNPVSAWVGLGAQAVTFDLWKGSQQHEDAIGA